ncbi:MAG: hypothetical protein WD671_09300 [Parvibaculum sp.]|jgi:transcriptional regulator GlxA family with amidase domain
MARKIFYNRRSRRRMMAVAGVCAGAAMLFSAGVYTGKTYPTLFSIASLSAATTAVAEVAPVALAAAEY